jgi:sirohydrochlorin cobaltochelatase
MPDSIEKALAAALSDSDSIGQVRIQRTNDGRFVLCHLDDQGAGALETLQRCEDAIWIARHDDAGNYRPLKTQPNLRHGWRLEVSDIIELRRALDYFYPGRLAILTARAQNRLATTALRETLNRQSGMYRIAAKITDEQIDSVVGNLCRSDGGCLRTILWKRDNIGAVPSTRLPPEKFDPECNQAGSSSQSIPLLCQEACSLLVSECRKAVRDETSE